jgi:hypothetical protein
LISFNVKLGDHVRERQTYNIVEYMRKGQSNAGHGRIDWGPTCRSSTL